ncbi:MFS transporter [Streptomyces sp. NPDC049837]|uniref:MFS transporter n=1 Tax=Streptomyces sp. NPDC049837 TaxID=3155277 RepID=UPI00341B524A
MITFRARSLLLLAIAAFASSASMRICDPLIPEFVRSFGVTEGSASWVISAFSIAYGSLQILYGPAGDRHGKYRVVAIVTTACALATLAAAVAPTFTWLVVARVAAGASAAAIIPMSMAWIGDEVPYERRQATLARLLTGQILGVIAGQVLGGLFADTLGWRWCFALLAGVFSTAAVLLWRRLAGAPPVPPPDPARRRSPLAGALEVLGLKRAQCILAIVFVEGMAVYGPFAFVPAYLHAHFHTPLTAAGLIAGTYGLGGLLYALAVTRLLNRIGERGFALAGGVILGIGFLAYATAPAWAWALPAGALTGLGFYMLHNTLQTHATQMFPERRGTAVSMFVSAFFLGQSAGTAVMGPLIGTIGFTLPFVTAALVLPCAGLWLAAISSPRTPPPAPRPGPHCRDGRSKEVRA